MAYWYRRVFLLAIPLILSNLTQPLLSTVDTILSGHLPGAAALGGVAISGIFFNSVFWTFGFLRMATTGLVAQAYGARDHQSLRLHFARAFLSALVLGAAVVALRGPLIALSIYLLGAGPEVAQNAQVYCHIRIWSSPAALANYVILGTLLGRPARTHGSFHSGAHQCGECSRGPLPRSPFPLGRLRHRHSHHACRLCRILGPRTHHHASVRNPLPRPRTSRHTSQPHSLAGSPRWPKPPPSLRAQSRPASCARSVWSPDTTAWFHPPPEPAQATAVLAANAVLLNLHN